VSNIQLLSELREKMLKSITINVQVNGMSNEFIDRLTDVVSAKSNPKDSTCSLQIHLIDRDNDISLKVQSKKFRINPDNGFLDNIRALPEVEGFKVNDVLN
jgi:DNA polymerase-3 subunit alpha